MNLELIKDISTIVFSGVAVVIAILTYRRARETFLQPVRSEVIKKQTELLTGLIEFLYPYDRNLDNLIDYENIVRINAFSVLVDHGFVMKDQEKIELQVKKMTSRSMITEEFASEFFEIISPFNEDSSPLVSDPNKGKQKYEEAKQGNIKIGLIHLTEAHVSFSDKLSKAIGDPFMPTSIKAILESLRSDIHKNLTSQLTEALKSFMGEVFKKENQGYSVQYDGVWNIFNRLRIDHTPRYDELYKEIRAYLKIDQMPS